MPEPAPSSRTRLRRIDWRFLLPRAGTQAFNHLLLLGGSDALVEQILAVGLARHVSRAPGSRQQADAVVYLSDTRVPLASAAASLVAGGVFYCEVDRRLGARLAWTPRRVGAALGRAGLVVTGAYWAKPSFELCEMYLPLDSSPALSWYFANLYTAITPQREGLIRAIRALTRFEARRFAALAPCFALTAAAGAPGGHAPWLLADVELLDDWTRPGVRPLLLTSDGDRVVLLLFSPTTTQPRVVVKIPKHNAFNGKTEHEHRTLGAVRSLLGPGRDRGVPQPLALLRHGDLSISIQAPASGRSLLSSTGRWLAPVKTKIQDFRLAASWLMEFHSRAQIESGPLGVSGIREWVETPLDMYARRFGLAPSEKRLFEAARARAQELVNVPFPLVMQHRDFAPWNIFRDGGKVTVIDWEGGRRGPAACDLLYLAAHWDDTARGGHTPADQLEAFNDLFVMRRGGSQRTAVHRTIADYVAHVGLDPRFVPLLLVYTWVELALRRLDWLEALGEPVADGRGANCYVPYVQVLARGVEPVFAPGAWG